MADIVTGSAPTFRATFNDQDGVVIDLTDATVKLRYTIAGGELVEKTASITDATGGVAQYAVPVASELDTPGPMIREWELTTSGGAVHRSPSRFFSTIRAALS